MADVGLHLDFDLLSASDESVICEGIVGLEVELAVDAVDLGVRVGRVIEVSVEPIGVDELPDVGCDFSEAVIEVDVGDFVLFAFVALACEVALAEDENIMDADALGDVLLELSQLIIAQLLGVDLPQDVFKLQIDEVGPIGSLRGVGGEELYA